MKNKTKISIIVIALLIAMSLFLAACAGTGKQTEASESVTSTAAPTNSESAAPTEEAEKNEVFAPDFTLLDQNGVEHTLSDYLGKKIIINFWASWCGPCKAELPLLQEYFLEQGANGGELIMLGVANPSEDALSQEKDLEGLKDFIEENELEYPTLMDHTGVVFGSYAVSALPTTFFIDTDGSLVGYFPGALTREIIDYAMGQFK
ncbi:MAG: redoxin domain-containing protein [Fastidiosipila sp.]|nr:redoxin domain-containing protein [Fastidiosipila sp.]